MSLLLHAIFKQVNAFVVQNLARPYLLRVQHSIFLTLLIMSLSAGELALRIPDHLVITLDRVFEDDVGSFLTFLAVHGTWSMYWFESMTLVSLPFADFGRAFDH